MTNNEQELLTLCKRVLEHFAGPAYEFYKELHAIELKMDDKPGVNKETAPSINVNLGGAPKEHPKAEPPEPKKDPLKKPNAEFDAPPLGKDNIPEM